MSRVSELEYYHPAEAFLHHSSPELYSEYYRPKLAVSYRRSRVSEIEYYHPLDAGLYRPLSRVKYYHPENAISYDSSRVL